MIADPAFTAEARATRPTARRSQVPPTETGAVKLITHRGPDEADQIKGRVPERGPGDCSAGATRPGRAHLTSRSQEKTQMTPQRSPQPGTVTASGAAGPVVSLADLDAATAATAAVLADPDATAADRLAAATAEEAVFTAFAQTPGGPEILKAGI